MGPRGPNPCYFLQKDNRALSGTIWNYLLQFSGIDLLIITFRLANSEILKILRFLSQVGSQGGIGRRPF